MNPPPNNTFARNAGWVGRYRPSTCLANFDFRCLANGRLGLFRKATMRTAPSESATIDEYIAGFPPKVQTVLKKIRSTIRKTAPQAEEKISYRMPAFGHGGILIYFAAFKKHIGVYPPVHGDARLNKRLARYRGEKGNLKFPLDEPIPYELIASIVRYRMKEQARKARSRRKK
jgi:uncharacterized protein YdhG (YjbR/CyaY superfamily)